MAAKKMAVNQTPGVTNPLKPYKTLTFIGGGRRVFETKEDYEKYAAETMRHEPPWSRPKKSVYVSPLA